MRVALREPFALILGAITGVALWSLGSATPAAAGVGAAVAVAGTAVALVNGRQSQVRGRTVRVHPRSVEGVYLRRARGAVRTMQELSGSLGEGPIASRARPLSDDAAGALRAIDDLAGRSARLGLTLRPVDDRRLLAERRRLDVQLRATVDDAVRVELRRSRAALDDQLGVRGRLQDARTSVLARLQSAVLGLESLAARLVEVASLTARGADPGLGQLGRLVEELESLRRGLIDVGTADAGVVTAATDSSIMTQRDAAPIDGPTAIVGQRGGS